VAEPPVTGSLVALLGIGDRDLVAFVGAGGKSTLLLAAGQELGAGGPVVVGTTTKMGVDQLPGWAVVCRTAAEVEATLEAGSPAFLLGSIEGHKVVGATPEVVDQVFAASGAPVLVEADGARRRPFKAPGPHEPVIPACATLVVVVAGLGAVGGRIADVCHRPELVAALLGCATDDDLGTAEMAAVIGHADGGLARVPAAARVAVALTQGRADDAARLASLLAPHPRIERVVRVTGTEPA
jgi:probable selenium-dependent hydroxylase accessory protein YqeC